MLALDRLIDLVIPRGSYELVRYVQQNTRIPVLGHDAGLCSVYVDSKADIEMAIAICIDAKTNYPAACNSVEKILVAEDIVEPFLKRLLPMLRDLGVEVRGETGLARSGAMTDCRVKPAKRADFETEFCDLVVAMKCVKGVGEAIREINNRGSHHTEAIITEDGSTAREFIMRVDSACVFLNASTRFSDGYRFRLAQRWV